MDENRFKNILKSQFPNIVVEQYKVLEKFKYTENGWTPSIPVICIGIRDSSNEIPEYSKIEKFIEDFLGFEILFNDEKR